MDATAPRAEPVAVVIALPTPTALETRAPFVLRDGGPYELRMQAWKGRRASPHLTVYYPNDHTVLYSLTSALSGETFYPARPPVLRLVDEEKEPREYRLPVPPGPQRELILTIMPDGGVRASWVGAAPGSPRQA